MTTGVRISDLPALTTADPSDLLVIVDVSEPDIERKTKHIRVGDIGAGGPTINGGVFITSITPVDLSKNVSVLSTSSNGLVIDEILTTTNLLKVDLVAITGHTNYIPNITVNGISVDMAHLADKPMHAGSVIVDVTNVTTITATHEDGATHTVLVQQDAQPTITDAMFIGTYPTDQTELKAGDTMMFRIEADMAFVEYEIADFGAFVAKSAVVSDTTTVQDTGIVANRGNVTTSHGFMVRVKKDTGAWSEWYITSHVGDVELVNVVKLNNTYPTISFTSVQYPVGQGAIKNDETAIVNHTVTNFDRILYATTNGELSIDAPTVYSPAKSVARVGGNVNISTNNFVVQAVRSQNGAITSKGTVVKIVNVPASVTITIPHSRLRSGGNDGTTAQTYTVTLTSNQPLISAPSMSTNGGTFVNAFTGSGSTWTRSIRIHDNDPKGSFMFNSLTATGLSGLITTTISSGAAFVIGGFVSRQITLPAFMNEASINVASTTYNKVVLSWSFKGSLVNRHPIGTIPPIVDGWCLTAVDANPTTIRLLDTAATESSSQSSTITIEELV